MSDDEGELLVDPEAGGGDDDSDDYGDDSIYDSSDEETGADGTKKKKKRPPMGKWKTDLAAVTQESIPEDKLHVVSWGRVALHIAQNMSAILLFVAFAVVAHVPVFVSLPLFMATFLLGVICLEVLQTCRIQIQVFWAVLFVGVLAAGMIVLGPLEFIPYFAGLLIVPLLLIVIVLRIFEKPWTQNLHGTKIWQALSGRKYGIINSKLDLAKLCKSMYHYKGQKQMFRCVWDILKKSGIYDWSNSRIQMVQVDESNPEISDVTLDLNGQEIEPDKYLVTQLMRVEDGGTAAENAYLAFEDLDGALKQRKFISDKLLDTWLNPAWEKLDEEAGGTGSQGVKAPKETRVDKVKKWIRKASFPPAGKSMMVARFRRYNYFEGLYEHWAPRAMKCLVLCALLSFPAVHILMNLAEERRKLCEGNAEVDIEGEAICGNGEDLTPCAEACKSFLDFTAAFNDTFATSNVEIFLTFIMIPVLIFELSVEMAQHEHNLEELIYLRRLRTPKKAIVEVMRLKATLEDVLTNSFLFDRLFTSFRAWMGADPALAACGPITDAEFDLTATKGYNNCLKQIMEPITEIKSSIACEKSDSLSYGIGYMEDEDDEDEEESDRKIIEREWQMLKFRNGLGDDNGRNYKVLFDLQMYTEDSWKVFKNWCKKDYKTQFDYICKPANAGFEVQDAGQKAHIVDNKPIHDILMPKGFCLTHIFVQAMPEDGLPFQIELLGSKNGDKDFWGLCDNLEHNIAKAVVDDEDSDDEEGSVLDRRLQDNPIVARFALSEQYYSSMSSAEVGALCAGGDAQQPAPGNFTEFCDRMLKPVKFEISEETVKIDGKEMENLLYMTGISVFMGDENPLRALLAAMKACVFAMRVWFECFGLAMLVPLLRFIMGKPLFPEPLSIWLVMNTVCIWICLVSFFSDFHKARTRLSLIGDCLAVLEQKTLAPAKVAKPVEEDAVDLAEEVAENEESKKPEEEKKEDEAAAARAEKKAAEDARPFDLVIEDSSTAATEYDPSSDVWVEEWRKKHTNVVNWHATVSHLRVFVSTSRLVAQTMLVAAALIVGFLLAMSLLQMMNAHNESAAAHAEGKEATARRLLATAQAGQFAARRLHEEVGDAMQALTEERAAASYAALPVAMAAEPLSRAARRLQAALAPAHAALHGALLQQHDGIVEGHAALQKNLLTNGADGRYRRLAAAMNAGQLAPVKAAPPPGSVEASEAKVAALAKKLDFSKATKTQIFTVVMVIFVMIYSVPLMWNIVLVNGFFDRHDDLLVKQKERHRLNHAKRVVKYSKGDDDSSGDKDSKEKTESSGDSSIPKDAECKRYEKTLDMTIEAAKKSRERFPLKLFGFVISAQLLATWVCLAASPIFSQAKQLAPGLAMHGCNMLEHSRFVEAIQSQMEATNPSMHIQVKKSLHENVCVPLKAALAMGMKALPATLTPAQKAKLAGKIQAKAGGKKRRLMAGGAHSEAPMPWEETAEMAPEHAIPMPDLRDIVRAWWAAHPSHHYEARYATGYAALQELSRAGDRLLVSEPQAVASTFSAHQDVYQGFAAAMGAAKAHLETAIAEEEDWERTHGREAEL